MILFTFPGYEYIAKELCNLPGVVEGEFSVHRFPNKELRIASSTPVAKQHCLVVGSLAPPDEQMLSFLLLCDTLKRKGAQKTTAVLPYLAYARQDRAKEGESLATAWIGKALASSGVDEVVTIDVHSPHVAKLFPIPLISIDTTQTFIDVILREKLSSATIVAPDEGTLDRCNTIAKALGSEVICFKKKRTSRGITHTDLTGSVSKKVIVFDDILDTGGTVLSCCEKLRFGGAQEITVMVTHGLFTGDAWKDLWSLGVHSMYCTDTIVQEKTRDFPRIIQLPIAPLLGEYLKQ